MRSLPAAAIKKGMTVQVDGIDITVGKVHNSTPVAGRITWETDKGNQEIGAATVVAVVKL